MIDPEQKHYKEKQYEKERIAEIDGVVKVWIEKRVALGVYRNKECLGHTAFADALAEVIPYKAASSTFLSIPIRHYSGLSCYIVGSSGDMLIEDYYAKLEWYNDIYK